ncbi:MAG: thioredoxin domain-containing protein [Patescibacteria group bacterium]|jgi:thiol-disulfide isomerase/thioredoxin
MALLEFYGKECPHCVRMAPLVEQLEKELGVEVQKLETWHDEANNKLRGQKDAENMCGGVPFFVNEETGAKLCGAVDYETLKVWATGK